MAQLSHSPVYIKLGQLLTHLVVRNKPLISTTGGRFPRAWLEPPRSLRSLWGLKAHGTALSFVPPKTFCYSRWTRRLSFQPTSWRFRSAYVLQQTESAKTH